MPIPWLEAAREGLVEALALRLYGRAGGVFRVLGEPACRELAATTCTALADDLASGRREALRVVALALVQQAIPQGLSFSDLRHYCQSLRSLLLAAVAAAPELDAATRRAVDDWLYEALQVCTTRFLVERDELVQQRTARQEVAQLEAQLGELRAAVSEKTQLLDMIRQASTPIAPVVDGILVVPLVGVFDTLRAELLTDKLLTAVSQARARAVLLDVSGVPLFGVDAAHLVVRLAHAVRLLGAELILVGLSAAAARTIIELHVDLGGLRTLGSLQDGLARALALRNLQIAPLAAPR